MWEKQNRFICVHRGKAKVTEPQSFVGVLTWMVFSMLRVIYCSLVEILAFVCFCLEFFYLKWKQKTTKIMLQSEKKRLRRFWLSSVTRRRPHPIAFPVPVPSADTRKSCLHLAAALRLYFLSFIVSASSLFLCLKIKNDLLGVQRLNRFKKKKKTPLDFNQC